jgi:bifunctional non-homologous end joining protein LigD
MGGRSGKRSSEPRFVIQEHHARSLHWDLRLERAGVLVSWALPKGLPDTPKQNHLAVHTEDHPLEYATFEGEIPKGEYGGGKMTVWDRGHYETEKWTDSEVKFALHGSKVSDSFVLFQTKDRNWMIHRHGPSIRADPMPETLRPMLATAGQLPKDDAGWAYEVKWDGVRAILYVEGGRVRALSRNDLDVTSSFPELAEIGKYLGMTTCVLDGEIVALDDDGRPSFARLQRRLHVRDGREARRRAGADPVTFVAFDVLYLDGRLHLDESYDDRRSLLESLALSGPGFITTESFRGVAGADVMAGTKANGLEGVVAKRHDSPYRPGRRSPDWIKVKSTLTQEVLVGGWTEGQGERSKDLGALLLGIPTSTGLRYVGKVGTGFSERARRELLGALRPLSVSESPFDDAVPNGEAPHFVRPKLVGEVGYSDWTPAGRLRHPTWKGLRIDKAPEEVVVEEDARMETEDANTVSEDANTVSENTAKRTGRSKAASKGDRNRSTSQSPGATTKTSSKASKTSTTSKTSTRTTIGGRELTVTNLEKVLFPETGFTKGQLVDYYVRVADVMLSHVADRPLTMKRFPDGVEGKSFFEKHIPSHAPAWVRSVTIPSSEPRGEINYVVASDIPTIAWAANLGTIEFHVPLWHIGRRRNLPASPDLMVFDLDPGEGTTIVECCLVAAHVARELEKEGFEPCAKTSGSKGLQLYVNVAPRTSWETSREHAYDIARRLESSHPELIVSNMRKSLRQGRVLIDWSQNHPAKTTIGAYSVRARPEPTVSTPVTMAEVAKCAKSGDPADLRFTTDDVLERLAEHGDLFAAVALG